MSEEKLPLKAKEKKTASPGEKLLHNMFRLLQVVKIHQSNNKLFGENVGLFKNVLQEVWRSSPEARFALHRGRFYLNDERIVYTPTMWTTSSKMAEYFTARGINGLTFTDQGVLSQDDIVGFMDVFNRATKDPDPSEWLDEQLGDRFPWVKVSKAEDKDIFQEGGTEATEDASAGRSVIVKGAFNKGSHKASFAKQRYSQALTALRTLVERLDAGKSAGVQKSKRAIEGLIDLLFEDEVSFMCLSTVRDADDQIYTHSVNTAILSILMGNKLGLTRASLEQLGLAGMFHDLGKAAGVEDVLSKPGRLTGQDLLKAQEHALLSVFSIIRMNASLGLKHSIITPAGEHHMGFDRSGYPWIGRQGEPLSLFGRLLAVADQYDALTSARPWRDPYPPHEALAILMKDAGTKLDPVILKVLVNTLGAYPPGTILFLDTHEAAIAHYTPSSAVGARPVVRMLLTNDQGEFIPGGTADLNELDLLTGQYKRNIVKCEHASTLEIQPVVFLMTDDDPPKPAAAAAG
jgi:HD-GYP domain-containing protein (c-di-GMP phosphodiesterase class II)